MKNKEVAKILSDKISRGKKALAVLIDPDKFGEDSFAGFLDMARACQVDFFFVGGSLIVEYRMDRIIAAIRERTSIPVILFPGSSLHIEPAADAILLLSLISGRNPELLIGQHVAAAPLLKRSGLEVLPTGYMLVESGKLTTVSYISNTIPLPSDKPDVAACTALAGEMLGLRYMYLDAGSGAQYPVPPAMIRAVRKAVGAPLIVGGGINSCERAEAALEAGADLIVVGNALERDPGLLEEISLCVKSFNSKEETLQ